MFGVYTTPIIVSCLLFPFIALLAFFPFAFRNYRKYGQMGLLNGLVFFSLVLYAIALLAFVSLPLPEITPDFCTVRHIQPQLHPFQFVLDVQQDVRVMTIGNVIRNRYFLQAFFNFIFFLPLGFYLRYYFRLAIFAAVPLSFGISLLLEVSQISGLFGIYPCPYRYFDVDDLINNTAGATFGFLLALLLRFLPKPVTVLPGGSNRVTRARVAVAFFVDLFTVYAVPGIMYVGIVGVLYLAFNFTPGGSFNGPTGSLITFLAGLGDFLILPLLWRGYTMGKFLVGIRIAAADGSQPTARMILLRYLVLMFPVTILTVISDVLTTRAGDLTWLIAIIFLINLAIIGVNIIAVFRNPEHRSLSSVLSGTRNIDSDEVAYDQAPTKA